MQKIGGIGWRKTDQEVNWSKSTSAALPHSDYWRHLKLSKIFGSVLTLFLHAILMLFPKPCSDSTVSMPLFSSPVLTT